MPFSSSLCLKKTIYTGTFIHTPTRSALEVLEKGIVGVDEGGVIRFVEKGVGYEGDEGDGDGDGGGDVGEDGGQGEEERVRRVVERYGWEWADVVVVRDREGFFAPGFVDTHTHASQLPNAGLFGNSTLLNWLTTYTFPLESRFSSLSHAHRIYTRAVTSTLSHGTTTAAYYATIHPTSTTCLADICLEKGQRAFIGNVCMDSKDTCPDYYRQETAVSSLDNTKTVIAHIRSRDPKGELVQPILTPRFAPSCTKNLLSALGQLASSDETLPIQTHISENGSEVDLVRRMFPECNSYAHVYDRYRLLTPRTVLAHGIYLSNEEIALIREKGSGISHCPLSNTSIASGICPVRKYLDRGVKVGLGTDVSGGGSCSVLVAAREAAGVSRLLAVREGEKGDGEGDGERWKLSVGEVFWLATRGGAECLGLEGKVGGFEVGMEWDAQLVRLGRVEGEGEGEEGEKKDDLGLVMCWGGESREEEVAKWMYCGDDRNTRKVWVKGRLVHER
ncbi:MAG: hypothetical protein Q9186_005224 [Xanthomendoza sp. 1 TL-2023]